MTRTQGSSIKSVVTVVAIGTLCWLSAAIVALAIDADMKYVWTCLVGTVLGLVGIRYSIRRNRREGI